MVVLSKPVEEFENDQSVEMLWAMKAHEHAEIYYNIICSADPKYLKFTPMDDVIYSMFRSTFPTFNVQIIDESEMKTPEAKPLWREYCKCFKDVEDCNLGTLLRANAKHDYSEDNSILVARIQFYAVELARNREGVNDFLRKKSRCS